MAPRLPWRTFLPTQGLPLVKHPILRLTVLLAAASTMPAWAAAMPTPTPAINTASVMVPQAPQLSAKAWVLMDADSGAIISSQDPDERLPPASLTKLMTV